MNGGIKIFFYLTTIFRGILSSDESKEKAIYIS